MTDGETGADRTAVADLARFVSTLSYDDVPTEALRLVERCFVDTVGVTLAGSTEGAGATAAEMVRAVSRDGPVSIVGSAYRAPLTDGVFVNGTASHTLDFDDVTTGVNVGHPSVTLVPAILGVAETLGASGRDAVTAFVAGFEAEKYVAAPIADFHYERGWHSTATFGTFGAAAAVANLKGLDERQTAHTINIAASMPAGLKQNFGTMTKPMHVGQANRSGVTAALLAAEGFTGASDAIDGRYGFLDVYSGGPPPRTGARHELGSEWKIVDDGVNVKKYPCCYGAHTAIAATRELERRHGLSPDDVAAVRVTAPPITEGVLQYDDPETGLEAKFSMPYAVASALVDDRVGLEAFEDEAVERPAVRDLTRKVTWDVEPDLSAHRVRVTVRTTDGTVVERERERPPGTHEDPLSDAQLREKFVACATRAVDRADADSIYERLDALREQEDVARVLADA